MVGRAVNSGANISAVRGSGIFEIGGGLALHVQGFHRIAVCDMRRDASTGGVEPVRNRRGDEDESAGGVGVGRGDCSAFPETNADDKSALDRIVERDWTELDLFDDFSA